MKRWMLWVIPILFVSGHTMFVVVWASLFGLYLHDDPGGMLWIPIFLVDLPTSLWSFDVAHHAPDHLTATLVVAALGGLQWFVWGWLLARVLVWWVVPVKLVFEVTCAACGYQLEGTLAADGYRCPECGEFISHRVPETWSQQT